MTSCGVGVGNCGNCGAMVHIHICGDTNTKCPFLVLTDYSNVRNSFRLPSPQNSYHIGIGGREKKKKSTLERNLHLVFASVREEL